jgi:hypothetical protein
MVCRVVASVLFCLPVIGSAGRGRDFRAASAALRGQSEPNEVVPIKTSSAWWSCNHGDMHTCGDHCCCDAGFTFDGVIEECVDFNKKKEAEKQDQEIAAEELSTTPAATSKADKSSHANESGSADGTEANETGAEAKPAAENTTQGENIAKGNKSSGENMTKDGHESNGEDTTQREDATREENTTKVESETKAENKTKEKANVSATATKVESETKAEDKTKEKANVSATATTQTGTQQPGKGTKQTKQSGGVAPTYDEEGYAAEWHSEWRHEEPRSNVKLHTQRKL